MTTLPTCLSCNRQYSGWDYCPGCYIADLEEALRPFAEIAECLSNGKVVIVCGGELVISSRIDDFNRARKVLEDKS